MATSIAWRFVSVPAEDIAEQFHVLITDNAMPYLEAGCNIEMGCDGVLTINGAVRFPVTREAIEAHTSGLCDGDEEAVRVVVSLASHIFGYEIFESDYDGECDIDIICNDICCM